MLGLTVARTTPLLGRRSLMKLRHIHIWIINEGKDVS